MVRRSLGQHIMRPTNPNRQHVVQYNITAMLPMFKEKANTPTSMQHSMLLVKSAIDKLNPGQTPCITGDQPLFATIKTIQWHSDTTDALKENNYMVLMGALHIEMLIIALIGNWLKNSGWTEALSDAPIGSPGEAKGVLKASHVTRARYWRHEISALVLSRHEQEAYVTYVDRCKEHGEISLSYSQWELTMLQSCVSFTYWHTALKLELLLLKYVRSIRTGDLPLYISSISDVLPWCYILDNFHYARWLAVRTRDMLAPPERHPWSIWGIQQLGILLLKSQQIRSRWLA